MLYPIKFNPIFKEKIWGGNKLQTILNKNINSNKTGESWEISGVKDNLSEVINGFLKGKTILDLIDEYKSDFLGKKGYEAFGNSFPLLIKFIDASDDLSVQVHPDDIFAQKKHNENGKNEMWLIVDADNDADIIVGVNRNLSKEEYMQFVERDKVNDILNYEKIKSGDAFYIPAGRIHAIMKGTLLAEIQQSSDLTYRIFDWNRKGLDGKLRELHTEQALEVVDLEKKENYFIDYNQTKSYSEKLVSNSYFTVNFLQVRKNEIKNYSNIDSFVIYMCIDGAFLIKYNKDEELLVKKGETVLIPAIIKKLELITIEKTELIEIYI